MKTKSIIYASELCRYNWRHYNYPSNYRYSCCRRYSCLRCVSMFQHYDILYLNLRRYKLYFRVKPPRYWRHELVRCTGSEIECKYYRIDHRSIMSTACVCLGSIGKCTKEIPSEGNSSNKLNSILEIRSRDLCDRAYPCSSNKRYTASKWTSYR